MRLSELLQTKTTLLLDGAMGTMLEKKGAKSVSGVNNVTCPEIVEEIHQEYIAAGSQLIIANTFSLNRIYSNTHQLDVDLAIAIQNGVQAAKNAAKRATHPVFVLGDIGPTGEMLQPLGKGTSKEFYAAFLEQAKEMAAAGVDGFIVETMFDLAEAVLAVKACREAANLPVLASMTFATAKRGGRTMMGNFAADCALQLQAAGAVAVGMNCGDVAIADLADIVAVMRETVDLPILVEANAGKPELQDDKTIYHMMPETYAEAMKQCLLKGASILGGCCGTTPEHIAMLRNVLKEV